jgi:hypothetical protein
MRSHSVATYFKDPSSFQDVLVVSPNRSNERRDLSRSQSLLSRRQGEGLREVSIKHDNHARFVPQSPAALIENDALHAASM